MKAVLYVDGSFSIIEKRGIYGGGVIIFLEGQEEPLTMKCAGDDSNWARIRNVAGELIAALKGIGTLVSMGNITDIEVRHDYDGIAKWVTGEWQAKKACTQAYKRTILENIGDINLTFTHVKGHSGDKYNELADKLAKEAVKEYAGSVCTPTL